MFGRGNWSVIGIDSESQSTFAEKLNDQMLMLELSQLNATASARVLDEPSIGLNPYNQPRFDESDGISFELLSELAGFFGHDATWQKENPLGIEISDRFSPGYTHGVSSFEIGQGVYGLWFIQNDPKDISDAASIKESEAYKNYEVPYKFLSPSDKKNLDALVRTKTALTRKQFQIILDFNVGRMYIANTNKNTIGDVKFVFEQLGVAQFSVAWQFGGDSNWPSQLLNKLYEGTRYQADFNKVAEDAQRFDPANKDERVEIEDAEIRKIVSDFFSMTETEDGLWVGLSAGAAIRLFKTTPPVDVKTPINATTLLNEFSETASIVSAALTIQERIAYTKKEEERIFRKDLVTFEINDAINITEVGAALLRGFDVPSFKKEIQREIKKTKQAPSIKSFWLQWSSELGNGVRDITDIIRGVLELNRDAVAGIKPFGGPQNDAVIE